MTTLIIVESLTRAAIAGYTGLCDLPGELAATCFAAEGVVRLH